MPAYRGPTELMDRQLERFVRQDATEYLATMVCQEPKPHDPDFLHAWINYARGDTSVHRPHLIDWDGYRSTVGIDRRPPRRGRVPADSQPRTRQSYAVRRDGPDNHGRTLRDGTGGSGRAHPARARSGTCTWSRCGRPRALTAEQVEVARGWRKEDRSWADIAEAAGGLGTSFTNVASDRPLSGGRATPPRPVPELRVNRRVNSETTPERVHGSPALPPEFTCRPAVRRVHRHVEDAIRCVHAGLSDSYGDGLHGQVVDLCWLG